MCSANRTPAPRGCLARAVGRGNAAVVPVPRHIDFRIGLAATHAHQTLAHVVVDWPLRRSPMALSMERRPAASIQPRLSPIKSIAIRSIHMAHKWIMAGLGLAVGMICYKM